MNEPRPTALQLLERHLEIGIVNDLEAWYALFDEDAVLEFPYAIVPGWHDNDSVISFPFTLLFLLIHFHYPQRSARQ